MPTILWIIYCTQIRYERVHALPLFLPLFPLSLFNTPDRYRMSYQLRGFTDIKLIYGYNLTVGIAEWDLRTIEYSRRTQTPKQFRNLTIILTLPTSVFRECFCGRRATRAVVTRLFRFCSRRVMQNSREKWDLSSGRLRAADSFRLSVSKNGVTQMFIIAAARRGKNVGGILLFSFWSRQQGTVCINLNGNCGDVSRLVPYPPSFENPPFPPYRSSLSLSFSLLHLEQLTTFRCLLSRGILLISRSLYHLFPARAVVDDDLTLSFLQITNKRRGHLYLPRQKATALIMENAREN